MNCTLFISLNYGVISTVKSRLLIGLISLLCTSFCEAQNKEQTQFLKSYFSKSEKLIYAKGLAKFEIDDIRKFLIKDTIFSLDYKYNPNSDRLILSKEERKAIDNQLDSLNINNWYDSLHIENSRAISKDSIEAIFDPSPAIGWKYFYEKYGLKFYRFSKPILFRNNTLCVFYCSYYCSSFCGEGTLMVFRKEQGNWIKWLTLYGWVS